VPHTERFHPATLADHEREQIATRLRESRVSIEETFYSDLDTGIAPASLSTYRRIARREGIDTPRTGSRRRRAPARATSTPRLVAQGPRQVLCWDISFLPGKYVGSSYALYLIIDLYSRYIVGYTVQPREDEKAAADLMELTLDSDRRAVGVVHSDNGAAMKSSKMKRVLQDRNVRASFIRPGVSNDNAHVESLFRTVKYGPTWPRTFDDITAAHAWIGQFVQAYNTHHHHSGLEAFRPAQVHDGTWAQAHAARQAHLDRLHAANPQRYRKRPIAKSPPEKACINLTNEADPKINPIPTTAALLAA